MLKIRELRQICQFSKNSPSLRTQSIEGRINRIFSIYFTWIFIKTPITPNHITILGVIVYFAGAAMFLFSDLKFYVLGLFLMFVSFILDACDGEVARYRASKGIVSKRNIGGDYVEPVSHDVMYAFYFLPLGIGASLKIGAFWPLIAAFVAASSKLVFRTLELRFEMLKRYIKEKEGDNFQMPKQKKEPPRTFVYALFRNVFTSSGLFTFLIIAVILKHIEWYLYFYAITLFLLAFYKLIRQWKNIKNK